MDARDPALPRGWPTETPRLAGRSGKVSDGTRTRDRLHHHQDPGGKAARPNSIDAVATLVAVSSSKPAKVLASLGPAEVRTRADGDSAAVSA
jgi:hypothetical protein